MAIKSDKKYLTELSDILFLVYPRSFSGRTTFLTFWNNMVSPCSLVGADPTPNCGDMTQASRNFIPQATATDCFRDRHKILAKSNLSQGFCQDYKLQEVTNAHLCHQVARVSQTEAKKSLHKQETKPWRHKLSTWIQPWWKLDLLISYTAQGN